MDRFYSPTSEAFRNAEEEIMEITAGVHFDERHLEAFVAEADALLRAFHARMAAHLSQRRRETLEAQGYIALARLHCQIENAA